MTKVTDPVSITLVMHGVKHTVEGLPWDASSDDLLDAFKRLLVGATFPPSILDDEEGHYEYVKNEIPDYLPENHGEYDDIDWYKKAPDEVRDTIRKDYERRPTL